MARCFGRKGLQMLHRVASCVTTNNPVVSIGAGGLIRNRSLSTGNMLKEQSKGNNRWLMKRSNKYDQGDTDNGIQVNSRHDASASMKQQTANTNSDVTILPEDTEEMWKILTETRKNSLIKWIADPEE